MATTKSETPKGPATGQTELNTAGTGGTTTGGADLEARAAALKADEERLARERKALEEKARHLEYQTREVELRAKSVEDRAQELRSGAAHLDRRQEQLAARESLLETPLAGTAASAPVDPTDTVEVLNNSRRAIGIGNGELLIPGPNTVSRLAWSKLFGVDGRPVPGAVEHFDSAGGKRPDLQELSLQNLSALPDETATEVVSKSKDTTLMAKFLDTEPRPSLKDAIRRRIKALQEE